MKMGTVYPRALLRDVHSQPGELRHGKVGVCFDDSGNYCPWIDVGGREVSGHPMDQRVLPSVEPLDSRQAISQRLEGFKADSPDLQRGFERKAAVDGPPSMLVAGRH
jgi:hypothetical protein